MPHDPNRRDFLRAGAAAAVAAALPSAGHATPPRATADACIFINLVGGPSQLDTFDPKPAAPADVRGPFRAIPTRVPGLHLSELFPKLAAVADKFSLIRSMHHDGPPVHEAGFQLLNTGRLFGNGPEWPSVGAVVSYLMGRTSYEYFPPSHYCTPWSAVETGIHVGHGFGPGFLGAKVPFSHGGIGCADAAMLDWLRGRGEADTRYGGTVFGQNCSYLCDSLAALPSRFITVNMFSTVFDAPSWDCHADRGSLATDLGDYRDTVAPMFDAAFSQLLLDLEGRGLLERTLVVATGEFGRTPHPNANGGRDHWPGCWSALVAGGGVRGGRVIGKSDVLAGTPSDRPVSPAELVATIYRALGVAADATIPGPAGAPVRVCDAAPVLELF